MPENKKKYEAPKVSLMNFDEGDILTASSWTVNCDTSVTGNDSAPSSGCTIVAHTDNTGLDS